MLNNRGPRIDPWGIPLLTGNPGENMPASFTHFLQSLK